MISSERPKHQQTPVHSHTTQRHGSPVAFFMGNAMETYNPQEAAQLLKCSPRRVSALCRDGLIAAKKAGKTWCITDAALAACLGSTHNSQRDSVARMESACQSSNAVKHGGDRTPHQAANELELRLKQLIKSGAFSHQNQATKNALHGALCAAMLRVGDERHDALPHEIQIDFAVVVLGCHLFEGPARPLDVPLARQDVRRPD